MFALWDKAFLGKATEADWVKILDDRGYVAGTDYPITHFYK